MTTETQMTNLDQDTIHKLKHFITSIEAHESEKKEISEMIKEVYDEAKHFGLDVKIIRKIIAERKKTEEEIVNEQILLDTYKEALEKL